MKTISVTIVKQREDGSLFKISIEGEEASKWANAVEAQGVSDYIHGRSFPKINWKGEEL